MNLLTDAKRYGGLSTRACNILDYTGFSGGRIELKEIISRMSLADFKRIFKHSGKTTYLELRHWCGLGCDERKDEFHLTVDEKPLSNLTLLELLDLYKLTNNILYCLAARTEIVKRFLRLQSDEQP